MHAPVPRAFCNPAEQSKVPAARLELSLCNIHLNPRCVVRGFVPPVKWAPRNGDFVDSTTSGAAYARDTLWIQVRRRPPIQQIAIAILAALALMLAAYWLLGNR